MTDTDRLRDLLEQAAPAHPDLDPTTRAATVARRGRAARNRNRVLVPVAVAAVVAVAVAVPISLGGGDGPDRATPAPPAPVQVEPCPDSPMEPQDLGEVGVAGVIVAARSCPVNGAGGEPLPTAPLTDEAAQAFVHDLIALPSFKLPQYCMVANLAPEPWALQIQDSLGRLFIMGSPMRQCSSVHVNGIDRSVEHLVAAFEGNLARQQYGMPALACPTGDRLADGAPTWNASFDPSTATAGVACYRGDPMGTTEFDVTEATLDDAQLAAIRDDLAAHRTAKGDGGMCIDTGPQRMVLLADADGDQAAWVDDRCTGEFDGPGGYWIAGEEAEAALATALGGRVNR